MFAQSAALTEAYINAKFGAPSKAVCRELMKQAASVIEGCKAAKSEVYASGPYVHGPRQQSQLDLLDVWQNKAEAVFDNAMEMMAEALN